MKKYKEFTRYTHIIYNNNNNEHLVTSLIHYSYSYYVIDDNNKDIEYYIANCVQVDNHDPPVDVASFK